MFFKKLKQKRMDAGALSLSSLEVKVQMESKTSDKIDVKAKQQLDTNSLVEEFMLLATISLSLPRSTMFPHRPCSSVATPRHESPTLMG